MRYYFNLNKNLILFSDGSCLFCCLQQRNDINYKKVVSLKVITKKQHTFIKSTDKLNKITSYKKRFLL